MNIETILKRNSQLEKLVIQLSLENQQLKNQLKNENNNDILFADWLLKWLNKKETQVKVNTYNTYDIQIRSHIEPYFRSKKLHISEITPEILEEYYALKFKSGLSGATLAKHHSNINSALKDAVKNKIISRNAAIFAERPGIAKYNGEFLSSEQFKIVLNHLRNSKIYTPVIIAGSMGLRRSEVLGLRWSDIDFEARTLCIQHTVVKYNDKHHTKLIFCDMPKTESSRRTLPLPDKIYDYLHYIKGKQRIYYAKNRKEYCKDYLKYVCVDQYGQIIHPDYLSRSFNKLMSQLNLKCRFHDLRHTCASLLIQNGMPLKSVSQWLGHSSIGITSDIYVHLTFQDKIKVAEEIEKILFDKN
ncbi:site-specific integrase [Ruminococcus sp. Marseille-P6503]|uniref:tyrosine-type recombinase/integrase n=1 Tax=Ruminococcus sp. Marseille-P6503 TaxID=2364796 RepID=UPI000F5407CA|nr:site-specific integrase [Ruminococcus sp. Marseille-P6503]